MYDIVCIRVWHCMHACMYVRIRGYTYKRILECMNGVRTCMDAGIRSTCIVALCIRMDGWVGGWMGEWVDG